MNSRSRTDSNSAVIYDVIIIGAGPAGLSAAVYASRKVLNTLIIAKNIGGQISNTWDIENYLGFDQIETADLIKRFDLHVEKYGVKKIENVNVSSVELKDDIKSVVLEDSRTYQSKTLIVATGKRHRPLNIPGENEFVGRGIAYCSTCDAPLFAGADVAVIGGGNSALEAVIDLEKVANKIYMISITELTGDQILVDKVKNFPNVDFLIGYGTKEIVGSKMVEGLLIKSNITGDERRLNVEGIFVEIGLLPNSSLFSGLLEMNELGEIVIDTFCKTSIEGVFACGDVTSVPYKQVVIAAGEGAKAALSAYNYIINLS